MRATHYPGSATKCALRGDSQHKYEVTAPHQGPGRSAPKLLSARFPSPWWKRTSSPGARPYGRRGRGSGGNRSPVASSEAQALEVVPEDLDLAGGAFPVGDVQ